MRGVCTEARSVLVSLVICTLAAAPIAAGDTTPVALDGRGGGVIAFCYQALSGPAPNHRAYAINADGSGLQRIFTAPVGLNHYDWSPDGTTIAAVGYVDDRTQSIYAATLGDGQLARLTSTSGVLDCAPAWSPDGRQIAFARVYPSEGQRAELWIMGADGGSAHSIGVASFAVDWSPDGARLLYAAARGDTTDVFTCRPDGTDERRLTMSPLPEFAPTWSPDGQGIAFMASADGSYGMYEIYVMDADGTDVRQLTHNASYDGGPRWSPDGALIAFDSDLSRAQHSEIWVMRPDGSDLQQVTHMASTVTAVQPAWRPAPAP